MSTGLLIAGIAVLLVTTYDFLIVTIGSSSRIAISGRTARWLFAGLRAVSRLGLSGALSQLAGVIVVMGVAMQWILGFWIGWGLVYAAYPGSIEMTPTGVEPELTDYAGHVGHLLSTLGGATTRPTSPGWNWLGAFVGLNGMVALTMAVSFLLGTRQTLQAGRALAALIATGRADAASLEGRLADLIAGLNASPYALYYGNRRASRRLPDALLTLARQAQREGPETAARIEALLSDLPHWDQTEGRAFMDRLEHWARMHRLFEWTDEGDARAE